MWNQINEAWKWLYDNFGYMSEERAYKIGFTHHGNAFGVPCWFDMTNPNEPDICAKWAPLDHIIPFLGSAQVFFSVLMDPDQLEVKFTLSVGPEIEKRGEDGENT
jgi:hypothetical protein